jgi:Fe-S-cluster formation regulator IscX/YfhJ
MELTKNQKEFIEEKYDSMDPRNVEFEDMVIFIVDELLDENIVDISGDEDGDAHEDLYNTVWEHLEFYIG